MAKRFFYSEENYNDFMYKVNGTGCEISNGLYEVEYKPSYRENED